MEITKDFEFSNIPFDQAGSVHLLLSGAGRFTVETDKEPSPEDGERMTSDFVKAIAVMYEKVLAPKKADYQFPALNPSELTASVKEITSKEWQKRGWDLKRAHFTALYPDDDGMIKLIELKKQQEQERQAQERQEQERLEQERREQQPQQPQQPQQSQPQQPSLWQRFQQQIQQFQAQQFPAQQQPQPAQPAQQQSQPPQPAQQYQSGQTPFWQRTQQTDQQPQQPLSQSEKLICPGCGADLSGSADDTKFCPKCGTGLDT